MENEQMCDQWINLYMIDNPVDSLSPMYPPELEPHHTEPTAYLFTVHSDEGIGHGHYLDRPLSR